MTKTTNKTKRDQIMSQLCSLIISMKNERQTSEERDSKARIAYEIVSDSIAAGIICHDDQVMAHSSIRDAVNYYAR